jgi:hypothetical protein
MTIKSNSGDICSNKGRIKKGRETKKSKILEHIRQLAALTSLQYSITQNLEKEVKK